jgi:hypothetical protein
VNIVSSYNVLSQINVFRVPGWTEEMQKFYDDIDPDMVDVTLDDLLQRLPADADW